MCSLCCTHNCVSLPRIALHSLLNLIPAGKGPYGGGGDWGYPELGPGTRTMD